MLDSLKTLLEEQIKDLYNAENQLVKTTSSTDAYRNENGVRVDANGNRMYDATAGDQSRSGYGDGNKSWSSGSDQSASSNGDWKNRNEREANGRTWRESHGSRTDSNRASWGDTTWNDPEVVMVNESDIPGAARAGLSREAGGSTLTETGRGMWDGKQAYCAKVMKNGRSYRVITDSDGNLIAMRRVD